MDSKIFVFKLLENFLEEVFLMSCSCFEALNQLETGDGLFGFRLKIEKVF